MKATPHPQLLSPSAPPLCLVERRQYASGSNSETAHFSLLGVPAFPGGRLCPLRATQQEGCAWAWPDYRGPGCSRKDAPKLPAVSKGSYPQNRAPENEEWLAFGSKGAGGSLDVGRLGQQGLSPQAAARELGAGGRPFPPAASTPAPAASTPFYEVISVVLIERRLLSTSTRSVLARKQVFTADLSKAKIS